MNIRIFPPDGILEASVDLPLSKSISARALVINKIGGFNAPEALSEAEDIKTLKECLEKNTGNCDVRDSGTALRFLTAYYAASPGSDITLSGSERLNERPVGALVDALRLMGANIEYGAQEGYPPLHIRGTKLSGGEVNLDSSISSQYISALMMIAPMLQDSLVINMDSEPVSFPYIKMTAGLMSDAGVETELSPRVITVPNTAYSRPVSHIERDWSAASYWYAITVLSAGWVTLNDMSLNSLQGDALMAEIGEKMGVTTQESEEQENALELSASPDQNARIDLDLSGNLDLVPTLAVVVGALGIPFRFTGVQTLHLKESDRIEALIREMAKFGLILETEGNNVLAWEGKRVPIRELPRVSSWNDHRIAMAFAPLALFVPGIVIEDAEVVAKSYPQFWTQLEDAGFILSDGDEPLMVNENME